MGTASNLKRAAVSFLVPLPSILFYLYFINHYKTSTVDGTTLSPFWSWCVDHPLLLVNALFFFNVNVLFWIISQIQKSHWMIDLYWTVIPMLLVYYYATYPLAQYNLWRSRIVIALTWIWSLRLTHNYFRREKWQWGVREDWRFTDMRGQYGKNWWWISFFSVYASQQMFLVGICLPFYIVHSVDKPLDVWDFVAVAVCLCGIVIAYFADTQLHEFVTRNDKLKELGKPTVPNLDRGLWGYSRHPNYFGEQLWWWGLVIFAWNLGEKHLETPSLALQNAKMALQEQLDRFKKQQEKCQSTLTSIAKSRPSKSSLTQKTVAVAPSPPTSARTPAPAVKFSNDTERLQHINSIRKAPAGAQIKRVIDLLLETRQAFTPEQINGHCYVDMNSNKAVFDSLRNNPKVHYDGKRFSYKSKHDLKDKSQLLVLIRKFPEGIAVIDLKDAYPTVMDDLQALKAVGQIWLLSNFDSQEDIAYPNDPRMVIKVDDDLKQLFRGIELPRDMLDIEKDLQKNGMKPATNTAKRRAAAQVQGISTKQKAKKKKHEISKRTKLTNAHLPELFKNLGS